MNCNTIIESQVNTIQLALALKNLTALPVAANLFSTAKGCIEDSLVIIW